MAVRGRFAGAMLGLALLVPAAAAASLDPRGGGNPNALQIAMGRLADRGGPVYCGGGRKSLVALTFDDGPGPYTPGLLRVLRRAHTRATFFDIGERISIWPAAAQGEVRLGFVGNHTWSHRWLPGLSRRRIDNELERTQRTAAAELARHLFLFRPPYGMRDPLVDRLARQHHLLEVLWSVDARDSSRFASPSTAFVNVMSEVRPGSIVLMHDLHPWTPRMVGQVLRALRRRHLRPVSVPELLAADPPRRSSNGRPLDDCR